MFVPLTEQKLKRIIYNKYSKIWRAKLLKLSKKNLTKNRTAETQKNASRHMGVDKHCSFADIKIEKTFT